METKGTRIARENRAVCNLWTDEERKYWSGVAASLANQESDAHQNHSHGKQNVGGPAGDEAGDGEDQCQGDE